MSELLSELEIVGHLLHDFDAGTHLSGIAPYVKNVLFCLYVLNPIAPFVIQTQAVEDRKQRFVIRVGFHPQNALGNFVIAHFLDHDVHQVFTFPMS